MLSTLLSFIPGVGPILAAGTSLFSNWKLMLGIAGAVALGVFVWSWDSRGKQIDSLEESVATLNANLTDAKRMLDLEKQASVVATNRITDAANQQIAIDHITQEAQNADPSEDGPVAPVLRATLDALAGLRKPTTGNK